MLLEEIVPFKSRKQLDDEKKDKEHKDKVKALKKIHASQKEQFAKMKHKDEVATNRAKIHAVK